MGYRCECGNTDRFYEAFDIAVDVVDNKGNFVETKDRNVAFYICPDCDREIGYCEFTDAILEGSR